MNNNDRLKNLIETEELLLNKVENIKRALKFNKLSDKEKFNLKLNQNKILDDLAKLRSLKKEIESKK